MIVTDYDDYRVLSVVPVEIINEDAPPALWALVETWDAGIGIKRSFRIRLHAVARSESPLRRYGLWLASDLQRRDPSRGVLWYDDSGKRYVTTYDALLHDITSTATILT